MEGNNRFVVFSEMFASNPFVNACLLMLSGQGNRDVSVSVFVFTFMKSLRKVCQHSSCQRCGIVV